VPAVDCRGSGPLVSFAVESEGARLLTCFMLKNRLRGDARVKKEALALKAAGWDVTILCWEEPGAPRSEEWNGISIRRLKFRSIAASSITESLDSARSPGGRVHEALSRLRRSRARRRAADFYRNAGPLWCTRTTSTR